MGDFPVLRMTDLDPDPVETFKLWYDRAMRTSGMVNPNATVLSTVGHDGYPDGRVVLLKNVRDGEFVFFSNRQSNKGRALDERAQASLTFYWESLGRQVRVVGSVQTVPNAESDAYFATRPRGSRIGAWASDQSRPLESRDALERRVRELEEKWPVGEIPRPPHWGGYALEPVRIEFWQEGPDRLHDRFRYDRVGEAWTLTRLYP